MDTRSALVWMKRGCSLCVLGSAFARVTERQLYFREVACIYTELFSHVLQSLEVVCAVCLFFMNFMCKLCMGVPGKENVWDCKDISNSWTLVSHRIPVQGCATLQVETERQTDRQDTGHRQEYAILEI